jgi:glycosyltransferase involved in cell wall biosynthesis
MRFLNYKKVSLLQKKLVLFLFVNLPLFSAVFELPIVVLSTSYNNKEWCVRSVESILRQKYTNYRVIYVDDHSVDGTADIVEEVVKRFGKEEQFMLIRNLKRVGALSNIYRSIHTYTRDDEIIVSLDGDDWFANENVLKKINEVYSAGDVWLTHGTMIEYPREQLGWSIPIPKEIIERNAFREFRCPSHLRTFYSWLFKKIELEDLLDGDEFFPMTWDFAIMFPMIEMAGERHVFISDITYVYNTANQINDNKVDAQLQRDLDVVLRGMPCYSRLENKP